MLFFSNLSGNDGMIVSRGVFEGLVDTKVEVCSSYKGDSKGLVLKSMNNM